MGEMSPARRQHTSCAHFVLRHLSRAARDHTQLQSGQEGAGGGGVVRTLASAPVTC